MASQHPSSAPEKISLADLFRVFLRIGMFTFGGGIAMLTVMRHELNIRRGWLSEAEFWDEVTLGTSFPGVIAVNVAFMQGRRLRGPLGAAVSVLGVMLPSFCIILLVVSLAGDLITHPVAGRFLKGAAAGVSAQLTFSSLLFLRQIKNDIYSLGTAAAASVLLFVFGLHPLAALLAGSALRMLLPYQERSYAD